MTSDKNYYQDSYIELDGKHKRLTDDGKNKEMKINQLYKQVSGYEGICKELKEKVNTLTDEAEDSQQNADKLAKALNKTKKDGLENAKKLEQYYEGICTELKKKINKLTDEADANQKNVDELTKSLNKVQKDSQEKANKLHAERQKYKELEQELSEMNEDHNMALENEQVQVEGLTGDLKETKKANKELRKKLKGLTREITESEERYKTLVGDFTRLKRQR